MNILDALILIILTTVFLYYCHKKKKLFFRVKNHGDLRKRDPQKPETTAIPVPPVPPAVPYPPYPYWDMRGMQSAFPVDHDSPTSSITLCRLIPWTFKYDPLPFTDEGFQTPTSDADFNSDVIPLGATLDEEIKSLNLEGYTVLGINAVSLSLGDDAVRALFWITCSGGSKR